MKNEALKLLEKGLSVIPLIKGTKIPCKGCTWVEQQNTLPSRDMVSQRFKANPGCNIGCITGKASNIVVVDADSAEAITWVENNLPASTLTVSNEGRGRHYYYKYPAGAVRSSTSTLFKEVDVRGDGGLVVLPPSIHKSGGIYKWEGDLDFQDLPEYPAKYPEKAEYKEKKDDKYVPGELKNIAVRCPWMRHCREDAAVLGYEEWLWMLSVVSRCEDGRSKCHAMSEPGNSYDYEACDVKISEALEKMSPITCRSVSRVFEGCFKCENLIKGTRFSPIILGGEAPVKSERVEANEAKIDDLTLQLTNEVIDPGGLISLGMEALRQSGVPDIPQYNFPVVISIIARAIAGKVKYKRIWPNFFMIKIGGTSTGKTSVDSFMREKINFQDFYGPQSFASGQGLLRGLEVKPIMLLTIDEASSMFKRFNSGDKNAASIINTLLEVYTNSGLRFEKLYANAKQAIVIEQSCVSIIGNATPGIFDDLKTEDLQNGLIQRFTFFYYGGDMLEIEELEDENVKMDEFVEKIRDLYGVVEESDDDEKVIIEPEELKISCEGKKRLKEFSSTLVDTVNAEENEGYKGIISRKYNEAIKYAMVLNVGKKEIDLKAVEYGINVANILGNWKLDVINKKVCSGDFHKICEVFKEGIEAAIKIGKAPTGRRIANRRTGIKNLRPHEFDEVVRALKARKEIEVDDTGRSTKYYLLK